MKKVAAILIIISIPLGIVWLMFHTLGVFLALQCLGIVAIAMILSVLLSCALNLLTDNKR